MLSATTRALLHLDDLKDQLDPILPAGSHLGRGPGDPEAASDDRTQAVERMRSTLRQVVNELDQRLLASLDRNRVSVILRYLLICVFCGLMVVAVVLALVNQLPTFAVLGGLIPLAPIAWFLTQLRSLQDERVWLMQRLTKFQPLIVTCNDVPCLQGVARQINEELNRLGSPVTVDSVSPSGAPAGQ